MKTNTHTLTLTLTLAAAVTAACLPSFFNSNCPAIPNIQPQGTLDRKTSYSPKLILPISKSRPDTAFRGAHVAFVEPGETCSYFNVEIPSDAVQNKYLNLVIDFPSWAQGGMYQMSGPGHIQFSAVNIGEFATEGNTTWNNQPSLLYDSVPGSPAVIQPGGSYIIARRPNGIPPNIGTVIESGRICSNDTTLYFHQGTEGRCPMGIYFVITDN